MKNLIQAAAVLFAASAAQAQQAVQWKVSEGGNGHWYEPRPVSDRSWNSSNMIAQAIGGHLATISTTSEQSFVSSLALTTGAFDGADGPYLGGYKDDSGALFWSNGETVTYLGWGPGEPNGGLSERYVHLKLYGGQPAWNDCPSPLASYCVIEWSADCNNDGIVDYGQCRDGSLPDYNGNNVPDCCEAGSPCVAGNYPREWRVEDGGIGHWYRLVRDPVPQPISWTSARDLAAARGGTLACIGSTQENDFIWTLVPPIADPAWSPCGPRSCGPFLGGFRTPGPHGSDAEGWAWVDGSAWKYARWAPTEPANGGGAQNYLKYWFDSSSPLPEWGDDNVDSSDAFVIEWSADCNHDGIVDKGQILRGQLPDFNNNGIPDTCEVPSCVDADIYRDFNVNGADLGILLSQWGPNTPLTESDLNADGAVDGLDLGLLLSFWGPCP